MLSGVAGFKHQKLNEECALFRRVAAFEFSPALQSRGRGVAIASPRRVSDA